MAGQDSFESSKVEVSGNTIFVRRYGKGPPILMVHGFPRTSLMWRFLAPKLAENHTIICADLPVLGNGNQSGAQAFVDEYPVAQPQSRIERGGVFQSGPNCRSAHRTTASMPSMGKDG